MAGGVHSDSLLDERDGWWIIFSSYSPIPQLTRVSFYLTQKGHKSAVQLDFRERALLYLIDKEN